MRSPVEGYRDVSWLYNDAVNNRLAIGFPNMEPGISDGRWQVRSLGTYIFPYGADGPETSSLAAQLDQRNQLWSKLLDGIRPEERPVIAPAMLPARWFFGLNLAMPRELVMVVSRNPVGELGWIPGPGQEPDGTYKIEAPEEGKREIEILSRRNDIFGSIRWGRHKWGSGFPRCYRLAVDTKAGMDELRKDGDSSRSAVNSAEAMDLGAQKTLLNTLHELPDTASIITLFPFYEMLYRLYKTEQSVTSPYWGGLLFVKDENVSMNGERDVDPRFLEEVTDPATGKTRTRFRKFRSSTHLQQVSDAIAAMQEEEITRNGEIFIRSNQNGEGCQTIISVAPGPVYRGLTRREIEGEAEFDKEDIFEPVEEFLPEMMYWNAMAEVMDVIDRMKDQQPGLEIKNIFVYSMNLPWAKYAELRGGDPDLPVGDAEVDLQSVHVFIHFGGVEDCYRPEEANQGDHFVAMDAKPNDPYWLGNGDPEYAMISHGSGYGKDVIWHDIEEQVPSAGVMTSNGELGFFSLEVIIPQFGGNEPYPEGVNIMDVFRDVDTRFLNRMIRFPDDRVLGIGPMGIVSGPGTFPPFYGGFEFLRGYRFTFLCTFKPSGPDWRAYSTAHVARKLSGDKDKQRFANLSGRSIREVLEMADPSTPPIDRFFETGADGKFNANMLPHVIRGRDVQERMESQLKVPIEGALGSTLGVKTIFNFSPVDTDGASGALNRTAWLCKIRDAAEGNAVGALIPGWLYWGQDLAVGTGEMEPGMYSMFGFEHFATMICVPAELGEAELREVTGPSIIREPRVFPWTPDDIEKIPPELAPYIILGVPMGAGQGEIRRGFLSARRVLSENGSGLITDPEMIGRYLRMIAGAYERLRK